MRTPDFPSQRNNGYVSQGITTERFGIKFRSKLEATWAYEFTQRRTPWAYIDSPWHDFVIKGKVPVEVKPLGFQFLNVAIARAFPHRTEWSPDGRMLVMLGEPEVGCYCEASVTGSDRCDLEITFIGHDNCRLSFRWRAGRQIRIVSDVIDKNQARRVQEFLST